MELDDVRKRGPELGKGGRWVAFCPLRSVGDTRIECKPESCKWGWEDECLVQVLVRDLRGMKAAVEGLPQAIQNASSRMS